MRRLLREILILCALAIPPAAVTGYRELKLQPEAPLAADEVRFKDAWAWGEASIWVDARPPAKFEHRHIPSALSLNADEWDAQVSKFLDAWDPEKKVIVYADRGSDAALTVAMRLREELKIPQVWVLHGGFEEFDRK